MQRILNNKNKRGRTFWLAVLVSLVLSLLSACATPPVIPLSERPNREAMLERLEYSRTAYTSLKGIGKYKFSQRDKSFSATQVVFAQQAKQLRVETLGLFNSPAMMLSTDGALWTVLLPGEGKAYQGEVSSGILQKFMQLPLRVEDVVAMLLQHPLLPAWDEDEVRYDPDGSTALVLKNAYGMRQEVWFDLKMNIIRFDYYLAGGLQMRLSYDDFTEVSRFPKQLRLELPLDELEMDFHFSDVEVNVIHPEGRFVLNPPAGYEVIPLKGDG